MAASSYHEALRRLLAHEGGYSNHPADPGGPTNHGITLADYRRHVRPDATAADLRRMPVGTAEAIYREKYWAVLRCDELPAGIDYAVFDYGVNSGPVRAARVLRRLLGVADATALVPDAAVAQARRREPAMLVNAICAERLAFLRQLRTWPVFGRGWKRRVAEVRRTALAMARGTQARPAHAPSAGIGRKAATGGAIAAGAAAAGHAHAAGSNIWIVTAILALTLAGALIVYLLWRRRRPSAGTPQPTPSTNPPNPPRKDAP